jgi:hypothetical protein
VGASKIDPLLPWAAGCQMVALNFQQVNLLFSYYGSAVIQGCWLSDGSSQFPTGQPLLLLYSHGSAVALGCRLSDGSSRFPTGEPFLLIYSHGSAVSLVMPTAIHIFPWICCCPGPQVTTRCLSVSNRLTFLLLWFCCCPPVILD